MKTFVLTVSLSFFLLPVYGIYAGSNSLVSNYPATSGSYNRIILQSPGSVSCNSSSEGMLFLDPLTNTLQLCTNGNATVVPYPETCFNRFWSNGAASPPNGCPAGYTQAASVVDTFNVAGGFAVKSTVCCSAPTINGVQTPSTVHP